MAYGIRFHFPRYHAKDLFSLHQCRDRERKGVSRNIVDRFEATIVYLLLPARFIEVDHLDHFGIVESGNVRILGDVVIFDGNINVATTIVGGKVVHTSEGAGRSYQARRS